MIVMMMMVISSSSSSSRRSCAIFQAMPDAAVAELCALSLHAPVQRPLGHVTNPNGCQQLDALRFRLCRLTVLYLLTSVQAAADHRLKQIT